MKITVFDTETTGLFPKDFDSIDECPYMLQLGSITYDSTTNTIINKINSIIKIPSNIEIKEEISNLNHITKERTETEGVPIEPILEQFNNQMKSSDVIIGHNLEFDLNVVQYECRRYDIPFAYHDMDKNKFYCTQKEGTKLCKIVRTNRIGKYYKYPKLEELHHYLFGENVKDLHDAYNDTIVCLRCYMFMNYKIDLITKNEEMKTIYSKLLS